MRKLGTILVTFLMLISIFHLLDDQVTYVLGDEIPSRGFEDWTRDMNISDASMASFIGEDTEDESGWSVSGAGDVNGDGYDDMLIGAYKNRSGGADTGQTYLILGKVSGLTMDTDLSKSDASFIGENPSDYSGGSVSGAGDVNRDGYDDILIGAHWNGEGGAGAGQTYLILGKESGWSMGTSLSNADASFIGEYPSDYSGDSVSGAGDVNGDGYYDILIGAHYNDGGGLDKGQTYLILGKESGWSMDTNLSKADASFIGEDNNDWSGYSVSGAGDVNGDGYDDILIGAYHDDDGGTHAGQTYLILGRESGWSMDIDLSTADASFIGEKPSDYSGDSVSGAGDVNWDGYDDILIGAHWNGEGGAGAGQTYLILGKASGWSMDMDLSTVDASFIGEDAGDKSGWSISGAGDVNGDGYDDILIGAPNNGEGGPSAGKTYLVLGKGSGWTMDMDLSTADASFIGEDEGDWSGIPVSGAGDINGDGSDEILIGASQDEEGGKNAGQTYLLGVLNSEPTQVYSFESYRDPYSNPGKTFDIGDTIYFKLWGSDGNETGQDFAKINISFMDTSMGKFHVNLFETDINNGIYQGSYIIPPGFQYFDVVNFEPMADPTFAIDIVIDYPFRPTSVSSILIYSDEGLTTTTEIMDYGDIAYFGVTGEDANPLLRDKEFVNLSSDKNGDFSPMIICEETDVNTGKYTGNLLITDELEWFENITARSVRDPTKSDMFEVHTPVQIRPFYDNSTASEDVEYREKYWNFGYVTTPTWTLTADKQWLEFDQVTLELHGIPDNGDVGITTIELNLTDTNGHYSSHKFNIYIENANTSLIGEDITEIDQGEYFEIDYHCDDEGQGNTTYHLTTNFNWLEMDPDTGVLSGIPENDDVGVETVFVSVHDGNECWDYRQFNLTVINVNDAPLITTEDINTIHQDTPFTRRYEAEEIDIGDEIRWMLHTDADFLSIDEEIGTLSGTPSAHDVGFYFVNVSAWDQSDAFDFHNFTLEVISDNDVPIWIEYPVDIEVVHGEIYQFDAAANDYDGDTISYSISSTPVSDIMIDKITGTIFWNASVHVFEQASNILKVIVSAWDGFAYSNLTFNITVVPTESPTVVLVGPAEGVRSSLNGTVLRWEGSDPEEDPITYDIYLAQSEAYIQALREEARIEIGFAGENLTLTQLDPGIIYFWTVIPYDSCTYGACSSGILTFTTNNPPTVMGITDEVISAGDQFEVKVKGSDLNPDDRNNLKYSLVQSPDGMAIDEDTGVITWKPSKDQVGDFTIVFEVSDEIDTVRGSFEIRVNEAEEESNLGTILTILGICILVMAIIVIVVILMFLRKRQQVEEAEEEVEALEDDGDLDVDEENHDAATGKEYQDVPIDSTEAYKNIQQSDHELSHDELYGTSAPILEE